MAQEHAPAGIAQLNGDAVVGDNVHHLMWQYRMLQRELAAALEIDQSTLSKKLRGERSWTVDEIVATARFLGVGVDGVLPGADYEPRFQGRGRTRPGITPPDSGPQDDAEVGVGDGYAMRDLNPQPAD